MQSIPILLQFVNLWEKSVIFSIRHYINQKALQTLKSARLFDYFVISLINFLMGESNLSIRLPPPKSKSEPLLMA